MSGIVEQCLADRLGAPVDDGEEEDLTVRRWLAPDDPRTSRLFYTAAPGSGGAPELDEIYGGAHAGILAGTSLKLAARAAPVPFGLPALGDYGKVPELGDVLAEHAEITFFMDAANVYFYGLARGEIVEYDAGTGELDSLGPPESAIPDVVDQWLAAAADPDG
jgi:hypothetical protein